MEAALLMCILFVLIVIDVYGARMLDRSFARYKQVLKGNAAKREIFRIREKDPNLYILAYLIAHFQKYPDPHNPAWVGTPGTPADYLDSLYRAELPQ
ncbi:MAG: hypothetical protein EXS60_01775 [Candidatus Pacebacteria bacterium]|nr:hypothetical protein [Candidatus Paceibacterota bacterium]